jgi:hypothetical protein
VKINEVITESQLNELGLKDLKSGIKKAGNYAANKIGQGAGYAAGGVGNYAKGWGKVGNRLAKQLVGKDPKSSWFQGDEIPQGSVPVYNDDLKPSHNGEVFLVRYNGQEYFKSYTGRWYEKHGFNPNDFSATHPLDSYKEYEVLDQQVANQNFQRINVAQDADGSNNFTAVTNPSRVRVSKKRGQK